MDFSALDVVIGGAHGYAEHIDTLGVFKQHIELRDDDNNLMKVWGACFDPDGDAWFALGQIATYEDYTPHDICYIPGTESPKLFAVLIPRLDDTLELWVYDEDAVVVDTFTGLDTDTGWAHTTPCKLCVACDGDTVYYTDHGITIFKYSLTTGQLTPYDVLTDLNYIYAGIDIDAEDEIYVALTPVVNQGIGPRRDVTLGSADSIWTDKVGETPIEVQKRNNVSPNTLLLEHEVSLSPAADNTEVLSLAAYYYPCAEELFFGNVTLIGAN